MQDSLQNLARGESHGVSIHSGFPNPALDQHSEYTPLALDINQLLIKRPASTFLFRITGHQWSDQGIYDGDIAVVDRAVQAGPQDLMLTWQSNDAAILKQRQLTPQDQPWGVVTAIIHQYRV